MKKLKIFILLFICILIGISFTNFMVSFQARNLIYNTTESIPKNKVGLILGAGKYTANGHINSYYKHRLDAAVKLYKAGKIEFILISGDNGRKTYDEPTTFKTDLIAKGIPENKIFLDYAGFRTLDSIVRAKEIFGQDAITIISQQFHNERAIYIAKNFDINAVGFNAKDSYNHHRSKTRFREYFARAKASIDILFNVEPKFLGKKIEIK
ncbi:SanA/YdcF family protein [Psychroserpens ponticola]|uniref:YdcF family protein n=1 Tax=Psychroserpens ponticola TaxID=2932268 RepID=A0ABY7RX91_9FLAO|nr:ElyC/SanA/YdcF family protein [Psychroserpens ponticola]WCO00856.1 YdcF family protein [Psychroserpens ponticola]